MPYRKSLDRNKALIAFGILTLLAIIAYQQYYLYTLDKNLLASSAMTQNSLTEIQDSFRQEITDLKKETQSKFEDISSTIKRSSSDITALKQELGDVKLQSADFSGIVEDVIKDVVSIKTELGQGSGAIISEDGYIVTNSHVVDNARRIQALTYDNRVYNADLIGYSTIYDIAVLKINKNNLDYLSFGNSDQVKVGERVIALGNPLGLSFSVTEGIISGLHREGPSPYNFPIYLQIDVPINPGNSGGPLINTKREIVGITNFKVARVGFEGLGFAIESNTVKEVVDETIKQYEALLEKAVYT
jgi:S1-C subfamily serine protease